jgi:hypothetical protein
LIVDGLVDKISPVFPSPNFEDKKNGAFFKGEKKDQIHFADQSLRETSQFGNNDFGRSPDLLWKT